MIRPSVEAVVVGAGPAGAATAIHLARRGRQVLLIDKSTFPRDKSCGDGLTRAAVSLLDDLGVLPDLSAARRIRGARLFIRGRGAREFLYAEDADSPAFGLVVPRFELDAALCRRAVAEGAELWEAADVRCPLQDGGRVVGVEVMHHGVVRQVRARTTVAADGAASRLAAQSGLVATEARDYGFAIRGYYSGVTGLTDLLEIYAPLLDASDRFLLPSYGWVFPTGPDSANVGVGVFQRHRGTNVRRLMEAFLASLVESDTRFINARSCSRWTGAPLRFDFAPERCMTPGMVLVGDAAGLISPFTGEGISYALESGRIAADVIDGGLRNGDDEDLDLSDYRRCLAAMHAGYFEAGRHAARRYLLVWHVLESTFHNERPLFALCRRAALFPEGVVEPLTPGTAEDVGPFLTAPLSRLRSDLGAVSTLVTDTIRREWPVLAQVTQPPEQELSMLFRPALLLLLSFYTGAGREDRAVLAAAAVELGYLAGIAHASVEEEPGERASQNVPPANWGNLFAVAVGDFLLSKAHELSANVGPHVTAALGHALATATEAQVIERNHAYRFDLEPPAYVDLVARRGAVWFELPCRLGAQVGTLTGRQVDALATYGRELGIVYDLVDEVLDVTARRPPPGLGRAACADGAYNLPIRCAARSDTRAALSLRRLLDARPVPVDPSSIYRLVRDTDALAEVAALAAEATQRAQSALELLADSPIRTTLRGLPAAALSRLKR